jgi:RHS repeat-associated protein
MDQRLATVTSAGTVYWHHTDHLGSVIATSDSNGQTLGVATYSPHGEGAPPLHSPFGFTGRQYDPETGLYYYRARYYSPYLGQFLTTDPIGTRDDPNLYAYVGLDPANGTDPTGKHKEYRWSGRNDLTIIVPIYIPPADASVISATRADISSRLSAEFDGSYTRQTGPFWNRRTETINVTVQARFESAPGAGVNNMTAVAGLGRGRVDRVGGQEIMLDPTDSGSGVIVHEVGHILGAEDHYDKSTFLPKPTWGGNLMGDRSVIDLAVPGGSIDQRNFDEIFSHRPTSETCASTGSGGRCK